MFCFVIDWGLSFNDVRVFFKIDDLSFMNYVWFYLRVFDFYFLI